MDAVIDELQHVLVARHVHDIHSSISRPSSQRCHEIISLKALLAKAVTAQGLEHFWRGNHLRNQLHGGLQNKQIVIMVNQLLSKI